MVTWDCSFSSTCTFSPPTYFWICLLGGIVGFCVEELSHMHSILEECRFWGVGVGSASQEGIRCKVAPADPGKGPCPAVRTGKRLSEVPGGPVWGSGLTARRRRFHLQGLLSSPRRAEPYPGPGSVRSSSVVSQPQSLQSQRAPRWFSMEVVCNSECPHAPD